MFGIDYPRSQVIFDKIVRLKDKNGLTRINADTSPFKGGLEVYVQTARSLSRMSLSKSDSQHMREEIRRYSDKCRFMYRVKLLSDNNMTVEDCGIKDDCVMSVTSKLIQLNVVSMDGRKTSFTVGSNDSLSVVEVRINEEIRFNRDEHILRYCGSELNLDRRLKDYGIKDNSVITISERPRETPRSSGTEVGRGFDLKRRCGASLRSSGFIRDRRDMNNILHGAGDRSMGVRLFMGSMSDESQGMEEYIDAATPSVEMINLYATTMDGRSVNLTFAITERIFDVKKIIEERLGIPSNRQMLFHMGILMEDQRSLRDCGIRADAKISIIDRQRDIFDISIQGVDGATVKLTVMNNETVSDLKKKIEHKTGLSPSIQTLKFKGLILRYDLYNLYTCNINANDTIKVSILSKMTVNILTNTMETMRIEILTSDRIIDVKKKIEKKTGVPSHEQILSIRADLLSDNNKTVDKCDIEDRDDILVTTIFEDIKSKTRGICLVISNEDFVVNYNKRTGTTVDEENIRMTFEPLGYEMKIHRNVPRESVTAIIEQTESDVQADHKMLIVFVLSHGCKEGIVFSDEEILPIKELWMPFANKKFPIFFGKPKLFYFVCCRTHESGADMSVECDVPTDGRRGSPSMADIFIGYATCAHYVSLRHTRNGTFYVQHFCEVVRNHQFWSVADVHQEVQHIFCTMEANKQNEYQVPYYKNGLTEHAYFSD